tara:strand:+ start:1114 stop:1524 length:411 start_codon:yes stop_codon:yes gene_type:complete
MTVKSNETIRIDKWLWFARFFKNRTLSARIISQGKVRLNGKRISKPSTTLKKGDALTVSQGNTLRLVKVLELGKRRGPFREAVSLYDEIEEKIYVDEVVFSNQVPHLIPKKKIDPKPDKRQRRDILNQKYSYLVDY